MSLDIMLQEKEGKKLTLELVQQAIEEIRIENPDIGFREQESAGEAKIAYDVLYFGDYKCDLIFLENIADEGTFISLSCRSDQECFMLDIALLLFRKLETYIYLDSPISEITIQDLENNVANCQIRDPQGKLNKTLIDLNEKFDLFCTEILYLGVMAIKTEKNDKILDIVNNYYNRYKLDIVEERIGERFGKYLKSSKHYNSLDDYEQERKSYLRQDLEFCTDFSFCKDFQSIKGWSFFIYHPMLAKLALNIDKHLAKLLSAELQTITLEYFRKKQENITFIRMYENGFLKDVFSCHGKNIITSEGYFKEIDWKKINKQRDISNIVFTYLDKVGLDIYNHEIYSWKNERSRHPLYLKGKPDNIRNYLRLVHNPFPDSSVEHSE